MSLDHLALLRADLDAFVAAVEHGPGDAPIAACPGWTMVDLGVHLGEVHRWVLGALASGAPPTPNPEDTPRSGAPGDVAAWVRLGADRLLGALEQLDPDGPTWHPFPVEPKRAGLWRRRQAQEASVHRWDAQHAIGMEATFDAEFAADGVDEYWTVMLPRMLIRERRETPGTRISVHSTDTGHRWSIDGNGALPVLLPDGSPVDGELQGTAASLLLRLWGRPSGDVEIRGDADVVHGWLALGGA